jgi:hypothetical protein
MSKSSDTRLPTQGIYNVYLQNWRTSAGGFMTAALRSQSPADRRQTQRLSFLPRLRQGQASWRER